MDLPLSLDHLAFCKGRDPPTNFKHLDFFNKHLYFPLEKSFLSKIQSRTSEKTGKEILLLPKIVF